MAEQFDVKLVEEAKYYTPRPEYREKAWVRDYEEEYGRFMKDPEAFWAKVAKELDWFSPWEKVLDWKYPYAKWFVNGKLNITYNCLDRHVSNHRKNKVALIWRGGGANESNKFKNVFEFKKYTEG
jgi:acetyl-CoA synthetase